MSRTSDETACQVVREVLWSSLLDFAAFPFRDLREGDPQALIFAALRARLRPADVPLRLRPVGQPLHTFPHGLRTSRAHRELKLGCEKIDALVLRADVELELFVHRNGALDIIAPVRGEDVAIAIEVKAAPSKSMSRAFAGDLRKLARIAERHQGVRGFFIAFDKSLPLGGGKSPVEPDFGWLEALTPDPEGPVEAYWLDAAGQPRTRRGRVDLVPSRTEKADRQAKRRPKGGAHVINEADVIEALRLVGLAATKENKGFRGCDGTIAGRYVWWPKTVGGGVRSMDLGGYPAGVNLELTRAVANGNVKHQLDFKGAEREEAVRALRAAIRLLVEWV